MPFGMCNSLATFQRMMDDILRDFLHKSVTLYLDDVCVYNSTLKEHLEHFAFCALAFERGGLGVAS
jgi:hypothetical protein